MDSLCLPTRLPRAEAANRAALPAPNRAEASLLIVSFGDPVALDCVRAHACSAEACHVVLVAPAELCRQVAAPARAHALADLAGMAPQTGAGGRALTLIVFVPPRLSEADRRAVDDLFRLAAQCGTEFIGIVSTFRIDLGDGGAAQAEDFVVARAQSLPARVRVFRPGNVLSHGSRATTRLRQFGFAHPLVPAWLHGCCVTAQELFAGIDSERQAGGTRGVRFYTLLGPRRPWRDWLAEHRPTGLRQACLTWACAVLSLLFIGHLAGIALVLLARHWPSLCSCNVGTLRPESFRALLALYNPYNYRHVKVVGYNNGVVHFGHRYPGKTVVATTGCNRVRLVGADVLSADCGTTVRQARDLLSAAGRELPVMPNYSYVCIGTAFFVPIHGSARRR